MQLVNNSILSKPLIKFDQEHIDALSHRDRRLLEDLRRDRDWLIDRANAEIHTAQRAKRQSTERRDFYYLAKGSITEVLGALTEFKSAIRSKALKELTYTAINDAEEAIKELTDLAHGYSNVIPSL